jgi:hypothetical protein
MRRKVIQEFVNSFCQRVIDLPEGYDLASFAHFGSGQYCADILSGVCSHNSCPIPPLKLCGVYLEWMDRQLKRHGIQREDICVAVLHVRVAISRVNLRSSFGHRQDSAHFSFACRSEIKTDEKSYTGQMEGEKEWGFGWYYEKLYGSLPDVLPWTSC